MTEEALPSVRADSVHLQGKTGGTLWLLRAEGRVETLDHPLFEAAAKSPPGGHTVVVDLTYVNLISSQGAAGLLHCARLLADSGRALYVAVADPTVERVLEVSGVAEIARLRPSMHAVFQSCSSLAVSPVAADGHGDPALQSCAGRQATGKWGRGASGSGVQVAELKELEALRAEVRNLRAKVRTHPLIDQALGVLMERYGLASPSKAFALLRKCSEVYNVRIRILAAALVADPSGKQPLTGQRKPPPRLSFLPRDHVGTVNCGTVLNAVLDRTLEIAGTDMGSVGLVDPLTGGLRLEVHESLTDELVDFFDRGGRNDTPCALAAQNLARVTIADVSTAFALSESARAVLLAAGCGAVHSTPLTGGAGCAGVTNAYMPRPGVMLTSGQARALDEVGAQAGRWLVWHRNTVVRDALKYLHLRVADFRVGEVVGQSEPDSSSSREYDGAKHLRTR